MTTEDEKTEAYNAGYNARGDHNLYASKETKSLITSMQEEISEIKETLKTLPTRLEMELSNRKLLEETLKCVKEDYVNKDTFSPVQKIAYGLVGIVLTGFMGSLVYLVFKLAH